jgi:mono/diheme cytochrome c family protein/Tfp pilus assembly protein PilF
MAGLAAAFVAVLLGGRPLAALWARQAAVRQLSVGAVSESLRWLAWADWLQADRGLNELTRAVGFRLLGQMDRWGQAVDAAGRAGAPHALVRREMKLGLISGGQFDPEAGQQLGQWNAEAPTGYDVPVAFLKSCLANGNYPLARGLLEAWTADSPSDIHLEYAWGLYWESFGKGRQAQGHFEAALARQPDHELARLALAKTLETRLAPEAALRQYLETHARAPTSELAAAGIARLLCHRGRFDEARQVLAPLAGAPGPSAAVTAELGRTALESGEYSQAVRWFDRFADDPAVASEVLITAGIARALAGQSVEADQLFAQAHRGSHRQSRRYDLQVRTAIDPRDADAARELEELSRPPVLAGPKAAKDDSTGGTPPTDEAQALYERNCSACHGTNGDGQGRAARHLYPWPTDLRSGRFRLTSTHNRIASRDDVLAVLQRGIPGTSMRAFDTLAIAQREQLAEEVLRLRRAGARDRLAAELALEGEDLDPEQLDELAATATQAGEPVTVPALDAGSAAAVARGKEVFLQQTCHSCHGEDGVGAWDPPLWDDAGQATRARDLVHEAYKGGSEPASVYLRIALGMPGTPHPAVANVDQRQMADLVHFCRSLAREPKRVLTNHQRAQQATGPAYLSAWEANEGPQK